MITTDLNGSISNIYCIGLRGRSVYLFGHQKIKQGLQKLLCQCIVMRICQDSYMYQHLLIDFDLKCFTFFFSVNSKLTQDIDVDVFLL